VVIRARTHIEDIDKGGRQAIIVDEIPYQVNKANLLIRIGELVRESASRAFPTCATNRTSPACAS
jgi:DNA gyrase subunit A